MRIVYRPYYLLPGSLGILDGLPYCLSAYGERVEMEQVLFGELFHHRTEPPSLIEVVDKVGAGGAEFTQAGRSTTHVVEEVEVYVDTGLIGEGQ